MPSFKFASATGSGSSLIVTCSDQFAGKTITCTNGTKTYTRTCPSTSPYEVVFKGVAPGTWTVSGVVEGTTYSQQVVVTDFDVTLTAGFYYKQWITLGGLDPTDYASLSEVFADEVAVRRLMTIHASADYLIEKVTDDIDTIDDFTANDTAMKWIGLRDYVCDGLTAIAGVEAKFLASQYWERYLKDHVPVMTSNTAPYGKVVPTSNNTTYPAWKMFDGDDSTAGAMVSSSIDANNTSRVYYLFTNPICIKKALIKPSMNCTGKIQYSDDGSTWTDATDIESFVAQQSSEISVNNDGYHLYWAFFANSWQQASVRNLINIQFYGRSLNVSVPVMTSNTAPFGEASASNETSGYDAYKVFDGANYTSSANGWASGSYSVPQWIQYKFTSYVCVKSMNITFNSKNSTATINVSASNDGIDFVDIVSNISVTGNASKIVDMSENTDNYLYYRVTITAQTRASGGTYSVGQLGTLQFYGVDYSEKEFETGSTKKWLYDHGLQIDTLTSFKQASSSIVTDEDDELYIYMTGASSAYNYFGSVQNFDDYSLIRAKAGDRWGSSDTYSGGNISVLQTDVLPQTSGSTSIAALSKATLTNPNTDLALDISSITGNHCLMFQNGGTVTGSRYGSINEWWLE